MALSSCGLQLQQRERWTPSVEVAGPTGGSVQPARANWRRQIGGGERTRGTTPFLRRSSSIARMRVRALMLRMSEPGPAVANRPAHFRQRVQPCAIRGESGDFVGGQSIFAESNCGQRTHRSRSSRSRSQRGRRPARQRRRCHVAAPNFLPRPGPTQGLIVFIFATLWLRHARGCLWRRESRLPPGRLCVCAANAPAVWLRSLFFSLRSAHLLSFGSGVSGLYACHRGSRASIFALVCRHVGLRYPSARACMFACMTRVYVGRTISFDICVLDVGAPFRSAAVLRFM